MALDNTLPFIQLQLNLRWRPDMPSLMVGIVLGILLTAAFFYWLPTLRLWHSRASGRLRQTLAWFRSGVEVRYQTETAEHLSRYHLGGQWGELADIMTRPRLLAPPTEIDPHALTDWNAGQLTQVWPELAARVALPPMPGATLHSLLRNGQRVLVCAPAGGGKTALLAYAAHRCAIADDQSLLPILPAYVHLAEMDFSPFAPTDADQPAKPVDPLMPLLAVLQRYTSALTNRGLKDLFQRKLKAGQALILLDGWDELPAEARPLCLTWLHHLLEDYPGGRLIMGVGLAGYGRLLDLGFARIQILPWRQREVEVFAAGWAKALNNNPIRPDRFWRPGQTPLQTSLRFWLVTIGGQTDASQKPRRQTDLMAQALSLLVKLSPNGNESADQVRDAFHDYWQRIAYYLLNENRLILTKEEAAQLATETAVGHELKDLPGRLPKSLEQCPIFLPVKGGGVRFRNLLWRDYLAAAYLASQVQPAEAEAVAQAALQNPRWRDVLTYFVARPEIPATTIATLAGGLLQSPDRTPTRENLFQVAAWLPELVEGKGEWQRQVLVLLGQIIRQTSFPQLLRQRAMAALMQTGEAGVFTFATQLLERSDPFLRDVGLMGLSHLGLQRPQEVVRRLTEHLEDGAVAVRLAAVQALAWLPHPLTERPLLTVLIDGDDAMSRAAAEGLVLRGADGLQILREALEDEALHVRRAAIYGLLAANDERVVPWLEKVEKEDKEWLVRSAATEAIETLRQKQKMAWAQTDLSKQRWLVDYAAHDGRAVPAGAAALPFLVQVLTEATDPDLRLAAAVSIGLLPADDVVPALETAVRDSQQQVSEAAFSTLCTVRRAYDL